MKNRHLVTVVAVVVCLFLPELATTAPAAGQAVLYLLTGTRVGGDAQFDTDLYRYAPPRKGIQFVRKLELLGAGVDFIRPDFVSRKILVGSTQVKQERVQQLEVIDMDAPETVSVQTPDLAGLVRTGGGAWDPWPPNAVALRHNAGVGKSDSEFSIVQQFVFVRPDMRHWLGLRVAANAGTLIAGVPVDGVSAIEPIAPEEASRPFVQGDFGLAKLGDSDAQYVHIRGHNVVIFQSGSTVFPLDLEAPPVTEENRKGTWWLRAHNGVTSVLSFAETPPVVREGVGSSVLHIHNRELARWAALRVPGAPPRIKAIGNWVMGIAESYAPGRQSPGAMARRNVSSEKGAASQRPNIEFHLKWSGKYYPGILFLIDSSTGKYYELSTDQGDSEILLVAGTSVYVRIANGLYIAKIEGAAIGKPQLLVKDDAIHDVHWAFMGPPPTE